MDMDTGDLCGDVTTFPVSDDLNYNFSLTFSPANHPDQKLVSIALTTSDVRVKNNVNHISANSEIVWCVPTNNAIEPGYFLGILVSNDNNCTASNPLVKQESDCTCPITASFNSFSAFTVTSGNGVLVSFCFDSCAKHHGNEYVCSQNQLCSFCGSGATGKCHSKEDGSECCGNEMGTMVCQPQVWANSSHHKSTCCKGPGMMPTCCASPTSKCNTDTATCECPNPQTNVCGNDFPTCCPLSKTCCPGGPSTCCGEGTFCCGAHMGGNICCNSATEVCQIIDLPPPLPGKTPFCASKNQSLGMKHTP